jgi:hypothetical protein
MAAWVAPRGHPVEEGKRPLDQAKLATERDAPNPLRHCVVERQ